MQTKKPSGTHYGWAKLSIKYGRRFRRFQLAQAPLLSGTLPFPASDPSWTKWMVMPPTCLTTRLSAPDVTLHLSYCRNRISLSRPGRALTVSSKLRLLFRHSGSWLDCIRRPSGVSEMTIVALEWYTCHWDSLGRCQAVSVSGEGRTAGLGPIPMAVWRQVPPTLPRPTATTHRNFSPNVLIT